MSTFGGVLKSGSTPKRLSPGVYSQGGQTLIPKAGLKSNITATTPTLGGKTASTFTPGAKTQTLTPAATGTALGNAITNPPAVKPNIAPLETQLKSDLAKLKPGTPEYWAKRAEVNDYLTSLGRNTNIRKEEAPYTGKSKYAQVPTVTQTPPAETPPAETPPAETPPVNTTERYFPGISSFQPENYLNSEMFKNDLKTGSDFLDRQLAASGLTGSSFNADQKLKLYKDSSAVAQKNAMELAQIEADRYERITNNEANRLSEQEKQYQNTVLDLIDKGLALYNINAATASGAQKAEFEKWFGQQMASLNQQSQPRATGGATGGGGGSTPFIPPFPSQPGISQADIARILSQGSSDQGLTDTIIKGITSIFKK